MKRTDVYAHENRQYGLDDMGGGLGAPSAVPELVVRYRQFDFVYQDLGGRAERGRKSRSTEERSLVIVEFVHAAYGGRGEWQQR